ncbi:MAG: trimethylamine methyltransferase family protein [Thermoplasmata archaeon]
MAVLRLGFMDRGEEDIIHAKSIECLEKLGVLVHSERVLRMLDEAGAHVDLKRRTARIPENLVNDAIRKAPKSIVLAGRDPGRDLRIPVNRYPFVSTGGVTVFMTDLETGERRKATSKDLADFARLTDALDAVEAFWPIVTTSEVPPHAQFANELWVSLQNTTKHILGSAGSGTLGVRDAKVQIALGELVAGGSDQLRKRPLFSVLSCIVPPLVFESGAVEAQVEYARAGVPIISMSMCMGGMTAPVTVAGTVLMLNVENLASLVITQTAAPGAPHIYCSEATLGNLVTGLIGYRGPEAPMIFAAAAQMARRYGLPKMTGIIGIDGDVPGVGIPFGEVSSLMLTTMSGTDLCSGIGGLDLDKGCSLEQVVIDAVMWEEYRAFMRDFPVNEDTVALDVIMRVGHGNTFLNDPHTVRNFRGQMFIRDKRMERYGATMSTEMVPEARQTVKKILKEHEVNSLPKDVLSRGNEILRRYIGLGS